MHVVEKALKEGPRTRDHHMLESLVRRDDIDAVYLIDRPSVFAERALARRQRASAVEVRINELFRTTKISVVPLASRSIVDPLRLGRLWWAHAYDSTHWTQRSRAALAAVCSEADGAICFVPTAADAWRRTVLPVHFDALDNWLIHPQLGARMPTLFADHYHATFDRAASVSANSEATASLAASFGRSATIVPNGVNWDEFGLAVRAGVASWRTRLDSLPHPWIVYAGKMQQRVSTTILGRLATRTGGTLLLAGPVLDRRWMKSVLSLPNVRWLGDLPYADLPGLLGVADVMIIPHRVGPGEVGGDPIKVYEYAAAGGRIVSTPIGGHQRFGALADVIEDSDIFVDRVLALGVDERDIEERISGRIVDASVSWSSRTDALLASLLAREVHVGVT